MSIEQQRTVEVLKVEVGDDYSIELTARDVMTGDTAVVSLSWDCAEGKHGACIGSAFVENGPDLDEVECRCTAPGHRGRS